MGLYFYSQILNSTRIWRVGEWLSAPLISYTFINMPITLLLKRHLLQANSNRRGACFLLLSTIQYRRVDDDHEKDGNDDSQTNLGIRRGAVR
jgi:hypothetical protein